MATPSVHPLLQEESKEDIIACVLASCSRRGRSAPPIRTYSRLGKAPPPPPPPPPPEQSKIQIKQEEPDGSNPGSSGSRTTPKVTIKEEIHSDDEMHQFHAGTHHQNTIRRLANQKCPECGRRFATYAQLVRHQKAHRLEEIEPVTSSEEDEDPATIDPVAAANFQLPVNSRGTSLSRRFICNACGTPFRYQHQLTGHLRSHKNPRSSLNMTGEQIAEPPRCSQCWKHFPTVGALEAHARLHIGGLRQVLDSGTKNFECNQCFKRFNRSLALKSHQRRVHGTIMKHYN